MRAMPDMTVLSPGDNHELVAMMDWANAYDGPAYLRLVRDAVPRPVRRQLRLHPRRDPPLRAGTRRRPRLHRSAASRALAAAHRLAADDIHAGPRSMCAS